MAVAEMIPGMDDKELANLRANAVRLGASGTTRQQEQAAMLMPLIEQEVADRVARAPVKAKAAPKKKAAAKPKAEPKPKAAKGEAKPRASKAEAAAAATDGEAPAKKAAAPRKKKSDPAVEAAA